MARSSIQGTDPAPTQAPGRDADALGPSDSSDSGSDVVGVDSLTDRAGTGERASVDPRGAANDGRDIAPDRVVDDPNPGDTRPPS